MHVNNYTNIIRITNKKKKQESEIINYKKNKSNKRNIKQHITQKIPKHNIKHTQKKEQKADILKTCKQATTT